MGQRIAIYRGSLTLLLLLGGATVVHVLGERYLGPEHDAWVDLAVFAIGSLAAPGVFALLDRFAFPRARRLRQTLRELEGQMADDIVSPQPQARLLNVLTEVLGYRRAGVYLRALYTDAAIWVGPLPTPPPLTRSQLEQGGLVPEGYQVGIVLHGRTGPVGLLVLGERQEPGGPSRLEERILSQICRLLTVGIEDQWLGRAMIDRRLQEATAEEEAQLNHRINAVIAHQLKTPLLLGQSMLKDALDSLDDPDKVARRLDKVSSSLARFERNVLQHLDRSRRQVTARSLALEPVRLADAVERCLAEVSHPIQKGRLKVELELPPDLAALADPSRLEIVLDNLLSNAMKAMSGRGTLTLRAGLEGGQVWLTMTDTGPGIRADRQERLFEEQGPNPSDPTSTGVGLAICRDYMRGMQGDIRLAASSEAGATFRLELLAVP